MKHNRQFYMNYFEKMENEFINEQLTDKQWTGIVITMYEVIYIKKIFTREELSQLFPKLLEIKD